MTQTFLRDKSRGFTVVELLIVIIVIGILAAISIVVYNGVQKSARDRSVQSDLDAVAGEITRYSTNNNGALGSAVAWYSGGSPNANIDFVPTAGNVVDVVVSTNDYCIRGYNPGANKDSITNSFIEESTTGSCIALAPSVAAGGSGANNLVGWWKLNGTVLDATGSGTNGTVTGAVSAQGQNGDATGAYNFNGTSDFIDTNRVFGLPNFSFSLWVYPTKNGGYQTPLSEAKDCCAGAATPRGFEIDTSYTGNNLNFALWNTGNSFTAVSPATTVDLNAWNFIIGTYDGATMKLYKSGVSIGTTASATGLGTQVDTLKIARMGLFAAGWYGGRVDDVRVYSRAISDAEALTLFKAGAQ